MTWSDEGIIEEDWDAVNDIVEFVCETWDEPDSGIWEPRRDPTHYVYSKVMCWSAIDRAIELGRTGRSSTHRSTGGGNGARRYGTR